MSSIGDIVELATQAILAPKHKREVPRKELLLRSESFLFSILALATAACIGAVAILDASTRLVAIVFLLLLVTTLLVRRLAKKSGRWPKKWDETNALYGTSILAATLGLFLLLINMAGSVSVQRFGLLFLFLIPLILISRYGTTRQWIALSSAIVVFFIFMGAITQIVDSDLETKPGLSLLTSIQQLLGEVALLFSVILVALSLHIIIRRMHSYRALIDTEREMAQILTRQPTFQAAYQEIASTILERYFKDVLYAFVLIWEEDKERLRLVGAAGHDIENWPAVELRKSEGITGAAAREKKTIIVSDIRHDEWRDRFVKVPGLENIRSEIAVPVVYENELLGIIDLESPELNAFDASDQAVLESWATALALAYEHFATIDSKASETQRLVTELLEAGHEYSYLARSDGYHFSKYLKEWFETVGSLASQYLQIDLLIFVRLAPATSYPLFSPLVWPRSDSMALTELLYEQGGLSSTSRFWAVLNDWRYRKWTTREDWEEFETAADSRMLSHLKREGIIIGVFLPVGAIENPLGALLVGYRTPQVLYDHQHASLSEFSRALGISYSEFAPTPTALQRIGLKVHQTLVPHTQNLFAKTASLRLLQGSRVDEQDLSVIEDKIEAIENGLRLLREQVKYYTLRDRLDLSERSLRNALEETADGFAETRPSNLRITLGGFESVEEEPLLLREVIYWTAVECMSNSIEHGKANLINISVHREESRIILQATDDGLGMPTRHSVSNPYGIFHLRRILKRTMAASITIDRQETGGTLVLLVIPLRPGAR